MGMKCIRHALSLEFIYRFAEGLGGGGGGSGVGVVVMVCGRACVKERRARG